jgi:hypothetical protein
MIDLTRPLDLDHPGADALLQGIQGNIIKGHGRVRTAHILLTMTGDPAAARSWVADFTAQKVTTAYRARQAAIAWRAEGGLGEPFAISCSRPAATATWASPMSNSRSPTTGSTPVGRRVLPSRHEATGRTPATLQRSAPHGVGDSLPGRCARDDPPRR